MNRFSAIISRFFACLCLAGATALLGIVGSLACRKSPVPRNGGISVAVSVFPLADIAGNIAGEPGDVFFVVPAGANPHTYEPVPSTVKRLQDADLFIGVHREFDGWLEDYLPPKTAVKYLTDEPDMINPSDDTHPCRHHREHREAGAHHPINPHLWLTPKGAARLAEYISAYLAMLDPEHGERYRRNCEVYNGKLEALHRKIITMFDAVRSRKFIQWHPAWDYLARDYDLEILGTMESGHGDSPSVRDFKSLAEEAVRENVRVIVVGLTAENRATEALAREIGGRVLRLDSIGDPTDEERSSYVRLMEYNAKLLSLALDE